MITIHTDDILTIKDGSCPPETLKAFIQDYPDVLVGVYQDQKIIRLMRQYDIMHDKPVISACLKHSENVFDEARSLFLSFPENIYSCIPVTDDNDSFIYYLSNEPNQTSPMNYVGSFDHYDINDPNIDYELISRGDVFLFWQLEEYTYQAARIIKARFPEKHIFFLDPKAELFFEESSHLHILEELSDFYFEYKEFLNKSIIAIQSDKNFSHNFLRFTAKCYCSLEIMTSLFWACDIASFGEENPEKTFYLIKNPLGTGGLADLIKFTLFRVAMVSDKQRGYIPVIDLSLTEDDNQFSHGNGDNVWTYFFDQLTDIPLEEVYRSKNVIISRDQLELFNPYVQEYAFLIRWNHMFNRYLKVNDFTKRYIEEMYDSTIPDKKGRIMGIIARGTDYHSSKSRWLPTPMEANAFLKEAINFYSMWECSAIFLATEDAGIFNMFMDSPLKDKLIYIDQERIDYSDPQNQNLFLAEIKKREHADGYTDNLRYFSILYTLSKCNCLLGNCMCGASRMALALNDGSYEHVNIF